MIHVIDFPFVRAMEGHVSRANICLATAPQARVLTMRARDRWCNFTCWEPLEMTTPGWSNIDTQNGTLVYGNMTCGPYPGGLILTHTLGASWRICRNFMR